MAIATTDFLQHVCTFFDLGLLSRFRDAGGYANRNLVIETDKRTYLAKILRELGPEALENEALYLERIAATSFPSPS